MENNEENVVRSFKQQTVMGQMLNEEMSSPAIKGHKSVTVQQTEQGVIANPHILDNADEVLQKMLKVMPKDKVLQLMNQVNKDTSKLNEFYLGDENDEYNNNVIDLSQEDDSDDNNSYRREEMYFERELKQLPIFNKSIKICQKCKCECVSNAKFCSECGQSLFPKHCTQCGFKFLGMEKFCSECGEKR
jgi:hypothetical protein